MLQLELNLVDRSLASTGSDLTSNECNLNIRAVPRNLIYGSIDTRLKHWPQSVANAHAQQWLERRAARRNQVKVTTLDLVLPL